MGRRDLLQNAAQLLGGQIGELDLGGRERLVGRDAPCLQLADERNGV